MATERANLIDPQVEITNAKALAARYRAAYIDLKEGKVDLELLRLVPVDMMFRYNFVPVALEKFPGQKLTFVDREAMSAGAFISAVTDEIYFVPNGVIGAAAPPRACSA